MKWFPIQSRWIASAMLCAMLTFTAANAADGVLKPKFELKDGDRVAFIGNTFIEREQQSGYIELALTIRYPDKHITFRNLGWSGDNVYGESRARFGSVQDGFKHLIDNAKAVKPTVLFVSYGHNAAFEGEKGLGKFIKGYERLLDALQKDVLPKDGRIVLITPHKQENIGPPLPDPSQYNHYLVRYAAAIKAMAKKRNHTWIDLTNAYPCRRCLIQEKKTPSGFEKKVNDHQFKLTDNGMHLTPFGYWHVASHFPIYTGYWRVQIDGGEAKRKINCKIADLKISPDGVSFTGTDFLLPLPNINANMPNGWTHAITGDRLLMRNRFISVKQLNQGQYEVRIDGKTVATASDEDLAGNGKSVALLNAPQFAQVEKLRQTIIEKNELFFHRWRPANETYIYLFRKHEQGNNAKEMPMFDPLIEAKEKEIAKLRKPRTHKYEIVRAGDSK